MQQLPSVATIGSTSTTQCCGTCRWQLVWLDTRADLILKNRPAYQLAPPATTIATNAILHHRFHVCNVVFKSCYSLRCVLLCNTKRMPATLICDTFSPFAADAAFATRASAVSVISQRIQPDFPGSASESV